jgi:hypothetical protein
MSGKNENKARAGRIGAERRWGPRRVVRLDELDSDTARLIRALLAQRPDPDAPTPTDKVAA